MKALMPLLRVFTSADRVLSSKKVKGKGNFTPQKRLENECDDSGYREGSGITSSLWLWLVGWLLGFIDEFLRNLDLVNYQS